MKIDIVIPCIVEWLDERVVNHVMTVEREHRPMAGERFEILPEWSVTVRQVGQRIDGGFDMWTEQVVLWTDGDGDQEAYKELMKVVEL